VADRLKKLAKVSPVLFRQSKTMNRIKRADPYPSFCRGDQLEEVAESFSIPYYKTFFKFIMYRSIIII